MAVLGNQLASQPYVHILAVTPSCDLRQELTQTFSPGVVDICTDFQAARTKLATEVYDLIVTEHRLGQYNGLHLAYLAKDAQPNARTLIFSPTFDPITAREARAAAAVYDSAERIVRTAQSCLGASAA